MPLRRDSETGEKRMGSLFALITPVKIRIFRFIPVSLCLQKSLILFSKKTVIYRQQFPQGRRPACTMQTPTPRRYGGFFPHGQVKNKIFQVYFIPHRRLHAPRQKPEGGGGPLPRPRAFIMCAAKQIYFIFFHSSASPQRAVKRRSVRTTRRAVSIG